MELRERVALEIADNIAVDRTPIDVALMTADAILSLPEMREMRDLKNVVQSCTRDVTVGHLLDVFDWQSVSDSDTLRMAETEGLGAKPE